ncbi:MAG: ABC transporter permease [Armatimonadota bacterium]
MLKFIANRLLLFIPMLIVISMLVFFLMQLPPGDFVSWAIRGIAEQGGDASKETVAALTKQYSLDRPVYIQYFKWISNVVLRGDFGYSMAWNKPVADLIWERIWWTLAVSTFTLLFTWVVAFPIAIYSATHQYSVPDYIATVFGFIGRGIPDFMLALILIWLGFSLFNANVSGLFSPEFERATWSFAKFIDLLKHMWVPVIVLGTGGTAGLIRILRANLLDELRKPYVVAARAKGMKEGTLIWKYPVRIALNPLFSTVGYLLPYLVSGSTIVSVVLNLPTTGPLLLQALQHQDMFLAGSFLLVLSFLTITGTLLSDILLAWVDPRVRYSKGGR